MKAATDDENWRNKYFDSLRSLESEERQFRALEAALKRIAGRLCIASLGQSSRLDEEVRKLQGVLRGDVNSDALEQLTSPLTEAIHALDHSTAAPATAAKAGPVQSDSPNKDIAGDERIRVILAALLAELRRDPELIKQVESLDAELTKSIAPAQLAEVLSSLAELVAQRIHRIEHAKQEVEVLLSQMIGKLDEISRFVADQNQDQSQSLASSKTLNNQLAGEMHAMGESVESAHDLQQIRVQVRSRLDLIGQHLQEFQQREATRASTIQMRNEQMQARVAALEAEARRLNDQLKDEQRLASMDVLTQVPNRHAYDIRIEAELQRWQRFAQPTCVAAWDIDHFKHINDSYGHRAGDRVLHAVARCLASRIRGTDFVARYGGEEFVMIFCGAKLDDAMRVIDEMRTAIAKLGFHFRGTPVSVTISCGITALQSGDSSGTAFDRADKALYQAKDQGRNRCVSG
jgi:diguanylate cyclase